MRTISLAVITILLAMLAGCVTAPEFDTSKVDTALTPKSVIAEQDVSTGKVILWGGVILSSKNLEDSTQIEVLAYPLDSNYMPLRSSDPLGRFMLRYNGYLETTIYTEGRMVSVVGEITQSQTGKVGDADYVYPVVIARQLHLWAKDSDRTKTSFHFGVGVQL